MEMNLDNMKKTWSEMSAKIEKQEKLTHEIVLKMAQEKSRNRLSRLVKFEILGICWELAVILFIALHFDSFKAPITLIGGVLSIMTLTISIIMEIDFIKKAKRINVANDYKQTLIDFTSWKKSYHLNKIAGYGLGAAVLVTIAPIVFRVNRNLEITEIPIADLMSYATFGSIGFLGLSFLLFRFFYEKHIKEIDRILMEIKEY